MNSGTLLVFEGLDGSGKTTQVDRVVASLEFASRDVVRTREPTGGLHGQRIRAMAASGEVVSPEEELRWFEEDRREHVNAVIRPALEAGRLVVSDRYFLSSVAYQGARGLDSDAILRRSEAAFPLPDLAVILEIDPALALDRVAARGGTAEPAFERRDFLERVAEIFHSIDRDYVERIDARPGPEAVHEALTKLLGRRLGLR